MWPTHSPGSGVGGDRRDCVVAKRAECPHCHDLMYFNKDTGQLIRHIDRQAVGYQLCAGSQFKVPVPNFKVEPSDADPRMRCSYCFKLLLTRADGSLRVHSVANGLRCEGSGRRPQDIGIHAAKTRTKPSQENDDEDFGDLTFRQLREVAAVAAELEAEQLAEAEIIRRMDAEVEDAQRLSALVGSLRGSQDAPEHAQTKLRAEADKWRSRGWFWKERISLVEKRNEVEPESWEMELDAAREALNRCEFSCAYIERRAAELSALKLERPGKMLGTGRIWRAFQSLWK